MMHRYNVVIGTKGEATLDVEVHARKYRDIEPCSACGQAREYRPEDFLVRLDAAYADGLALGEMLREKGVNDFKRGLRAGLGGA